LYPLSPSPSAPIKHPSSTSFVLRSLQAAPKPSILTALFGGSASDCGPMDQPMAGVVGLYKLNPADPCTLMKAPGFISFNP
jgi:hypothetical protein